MTNDKSVEDDLRTILEAVRRMIVCVGQDELAAKDREIKKLARREDELTDQVEKSVDTLLERTQQMRSYRTDLEKMTELHAACEGRKNLHEQEIRELKEALEVIREKAADPRNVPPW